jgi:Flp pilus assembly protein TadG
MGFLGRVRSRVDRGAAAVEFAIISVPLFLLLFGIIQFGFVFFQQITITQAAREGARSLSLNIGTGTPGTCDASCISAVKSRTVSAAAPGVTLSSATSFDTVQTCPAGATQSSSAIVQVHYQVSVALLFTVTISGKASMPCGG